MERYGKYASFKTDSKNSKIIFMLFTFFLQRSLGVDYADIFEATGGWGLSAMSLFREWVALWVCSRFSELQAQNTSREEN